MTISYSLLDEPWLPVRFKSGQVCRVGLREVFLKSADILDLADSTPTSRVAQYRLLFAILHRALTLQYGHWDNEDDREKWFRSGLPEVAIHAYFSAWSDRFDLFSPTHPFMQVAALGELPETKDKKKPWTQISLVSATGNNAVLFDHTCDENPKSTSPAEALCALLGFLQFVPGGLVKVIKGADTAGALANSAAIIPLGESLLETLCLGLSPPDFDATCQEMNCPAWEGAPLARHDLERAPVPPSGNNDRYTRLSRAVLFLREIDGTVKYLRFAEGCALAEDSDHFDPMVSYRETSTKKWVRINFVEGRAFWRDLPSLLPHSIGHGAGPAPILIYANSLKKRWLPLLVAGLTSDQAKLIRSRIECFDFPIALRNIPEACATVKAMVKCTEDVFSCLRWWVSIMLAETLPDPNHKETRARARNCFNNSPIPAQFFARAERGLGDFLAALDTLYSDEGLSEEEKEAGITACRQTFKALLHDAACESWRLGRLLLGNPRALVLRAEVKTYRYFIANLKKMDLKHKEGGVG